MLLPFKLLFSRAFHDFICLVVIHSLQIITEFKLFYPSTIIDLPFSMVFKKCFQPIQRIGIFLLFDLFQISFII